jgi:hypothetical protein
MTAVIGVHGIMNQQLGRHQLNGEWGRALADGIERAVGHKVAIPDLNIVFYSDLFLAGTSKADAIGSADEPAGLTEEDVGALRLFAEEVAGALASSPLTDGEPAAKGRTSFSCRCSRSYWQLDKRLASRKDSLLFLGKLKQVRRYLLDPAVKAEADNRAEKVITRGGRVLIGHSLGSVVEFE